MTLYDPAALEFAVQSALKEAQGIDEHVHGAFLTVANMDGIKAVIAVRDDKGWRVQATVESAWADLDKMRFGVYICGTY